MGQLLKLYEKWLKSGRMDEPGFCLSFEPGDTYGEYSEIFNLIKPSIEDLKTLRNEDLSSTYWASGIKRYSTHIYYTFTPLRQTLLLLMAAEAGEL